MVSYMINSTNTDLKNKEYPIFESQRSNNKEFELSKRTLKFSKDVINFVKDMQKNIINNEILKQLIRSSSSIGANYIEANDSLGKKDFFMHIRICRKEAKETEYWLQLVDLNDPKAQNICALLTDEALQLRKIFSSIAKKSH